MQQPVLKPTVVNTTDLPLCCPPRHETAWNLHPRVYLTVTNQSPPQAICPYCGAIYQLQ